MAYALSFTGGTATLQSAITLDNTSGGSWKIEVRTLANWSGARGFFRGAQSTPDRLVKGTDGNLLLRSRFSSGNTNNITGSTNLTWVNSTEYTVALIGDADGTVRAERNGVNYPLGTGGRTFQLFIFGDGNTINLFSGLMYEAKVFRNGNLTNHWLNTNGIGNEWTDIVGGNNAALTGSWPSDNSQWVFYDDGAGSTEQITSSGGIASAVAGGAASTQIINEQVLGASGIAAAVAAGIASATIVNEQVNSSGGIASAIASASSSTSVINEQVVSSGGIAAAIAGATASTQVINEQTSEQVVSSGGIAASTGSASASTQIISERVVSSGGVAAATATGVAAVTIVNSQVITASGVAAAVAGMVATTTTLQVDGIPDTSTPYLDIGADWVNVYAAANLPLGSSVVLQNVGATPLFLSATGTAPASNVGLLVMPGQHIEVASDVTGLFARSILPKGAAITARTRTHFSELRPLLIDSAPQPSASGVQPVMYWGEATASWQTVQSLTGLARGQQLVVQNIGDSPLYLASRNIPPSDLYDLVARPGELIEFNGPELLWLKTPANKGLFTAQPRSHFQFVRPVADLSYSMVATYR